ncbi:MAG: TIGR03619 family F420-dependent LLM class oxidoreductase [Candidatus Microthrix sp.]|nr:TIGR03619 family F420-dependent LLM class oxidoreductase [Candidatus Microthrix sp.]MBK6438668.1 TIGR03619 family F420-dependent LLM class oxidoreductase [Candidatus Microthrix sp.]
MRFSLALAMTQPGRIVALSKAAEAAGWHGVTMPESVFYPEEVSAKYPYSADGQRFWPSDADWVDPWVAIPAIAASTERLMLGTNVTKLALRHPLLMAKTVGSAAAMFPGRIELGVGLSWIPEEFAWLGQDMSTRGVRLDEQVDVMRKVLAGGWVEHHGRFYDFDRMRMDPAAEPSVPIHIGGHSNAGLRRALLRGDGWIGAQGDLAAVREVIGRLGELREQLGDDVRVPAERFEVKLTPIVAPTVDAMEELAALGVTEVITVPWYFYGDDPEDPKAQDEAVARFGDEVIAPMAKR